MDDTFAVICEEEQLGIRRITTDDPDYPEIFRQLPRMPRAFYVRGNLPDPNRLCVAIVGARGCSGYGRTEAVKFGKTLSEHGVQVISGMADGIDSWAQDGALQGGTPTFSVLGSGVNVCYPKKNHALYKKILQKGGGMISEFEPGDLPLAWHFPLRNRLISAFADLVLVVEAKTRSGSLITVDYAIEQGKDVYAVPGRNQDILSQGCNRLIAQGAGIAWNPYVILEALGIEEFCENNGQKNQKSKYTECPETVEPGRKEGTGPKQIKNDSSPDREAVLKRNEKLPAHRLERENGATLSMDRAEKAEQRTLPAQWEHARDFQMVYAKLSRNPISLDQLQKSTGMQIGALSSVLMQLCLSGYAEESAPGHYAAVFGDHQQ